MSTYVIAVSGGVDSVALLDMMSRLPDHQLVIAHFDHGIREDSAQDAAFVRSLAKKYGVPFESRREELGPSASEEKARARRYHFLRSVAKKHDGKIVTAHHADDVVETIAINVKRGTGWRGLAVLDSDIVRPLLDMSKDELREYAKRHQLEWREDSTNKSDVYLRNRIRKTVKSLSRDERRQLLALRAHQRHTKQEIDEEVKRLIGKGPHYSRYFFTHVPKPVAVECLREVVKGRLTRPQLERALLAIKTATPGSTHQAGSSVSLRFTSRNFSV
jgi:tRNA(Ile)-lysidine synthase